MGIKSFFAKTAANVALKAKVVAPHVCVGFGIVGLVGAGVLACVQTVKHFDEIIDEHNEGMEKVRKIKEMAESGEVEIKKEEIQQGTAGVYLKTFYKGVKVYILPIGLAALSITSIIYGHGLLNKRYLATTAAFTALKEAYDASRERARDRFGEDIERNIFDDVQKELVTKQTVDEQTGEVKEETAEEFVARSNEMMKHPYTFMFTADTSTMWMRHPGANENTIDSVQRDLNGVLKWRGYVTLNEVLLRLGLDPVEEGFIHGWTTKKLNEDGKLPVIKLTATPIHADPDDSGYFRGGTPDYYISMNVQGVITGFKKASEMPKKPRVKAIFKGAKGDV